MGSGMEVPHTDSRGGNKRTGGRGIAFLVRRVRDDKSGTASMLVGPGEGLPKGDLLLVVGLCRAQIGCTC